MSPRGRVVGATGSGKSTTLASMLDYRNRTKGGHILTIEDPVEYLHAHRTSVIDQREVGIDAQSDANALRNAMREANVIMIGETRDRETKQHAIPYAETGICASRRRTPTTRIRRSIASSISSPTRRGISS